MARDDRRRDQRVDTRHALHLAHRLRANIDPDELRVGDRHLPVAAQRRLDLVEGIAPARDAHLPG